MSCEREARVIYILINFLPILAATVAGFVFGGLYYRALSKPWMSAARLSEDDIKAKDGKVSPAPFIIAFVAEFWIASILAGAIILAPPQAGEWTMALGTAFIIFIGFVFPTMVVNDRYGMQSFRLTLINAGRWLAVFLIHVIVLQAIGLEPPPGA